MRDISKFLFIAALVAVAGAPAFAAEKAEKPAWVSPVPDLAGDPVAGRPKSESCATCHGDEGFSTHNYFPVLAGQTEEYMLFQLHYYRSGKRFHPLMTPLTKDLTDQDIADLSAFYASIEITRAVEPEVAPAVGFGNGHWIDLTHDFSEDTISHPRGQLFVQTPSMVGMTRGGYFMSTYNYSGGEHAGTHLDAPVHFNEGGQSIDQISLDRLMGDVIVIDVKDQVAADPEYLASVGVVLEWEEAHGEIPENSIVLFNTGLANVWPDNAKYVGTDKRGAEGLAEMKIPGIHRDAASLLSVERGIKVVGMDSLSFDNSRQLDRASHRIFFEHGIPGIENIANLDALPATGAYMMALPMKIRGGSGAPVRIIAFVQDAAQ